MAMRTLLLAARNSPTELLLKHIRMACPANKIESCSANNATIQYKAVTHVIFDLDGTLLDTEGIYQAILRDMVEAVGKKFTDNLRNKILGLKEPDTIKVVISELGLEGKVNPNEFLIEYLNKSNAALGGVQLMPGAKKLLLHLHEHKIPFGLATSSSDDAVKIKTAHLTELFSKFHHMVMATSDPEVTHGKPAPDIYLICAARFDPPADPEKCLVFEDAPNGATGSIKANMQVVAIPDPTVSKDLFPKETTLFLKTLEEFVPEAFGLPPYDNCNCRGLL